MDDEARDVHEKVSRLPGLPQPLDPIAAQIFEESKKRGSSLLNLHLVNAHAPRLSRAKKPMTYALRSECASPRIYREIAIVRAAQMVGCDYEEHHHRPFAIACGMSEEAVEHIATWSQRKDLFDARQLAVLAYVEEMCGNLGNVSDGAFAGMEAHFTPEEIVEITACATSYYGGGMYMKALGIKRDPPHRKPAPGVF